LLRQCKMGTTRRSPLHDRIIWGQFVRADGARRPPHCGISTRLMSALGQSRRIDTAPAVAACPLRPESDRRRSKCDPSLRAANHPQNVGTIGNRAFCDGHHVTRHALVYIPPTSCPARSAPCLTNGCRVQHRIGRERCQRITRRERSA
jgi:hypothetical protein